jgi:RNAse (barnase) inhibitor barstar
VNEPRRAAIASPNTALHPTPAELTQSGRGERDVVLRTEKMATTYDIDGRAFTTLEGFFEEMSRVLIPGADWGHNLDAFNDILRGGFGTPEEGFTFRWLNHDVSRKRLAYPETMRQLQLRLQRCHSTNREYVARQLEQARRGSGPTVFDWLVEIIQAHGAGGDESEDGVRLVLA